MSSEDLLAAAWIASLYSLDRPDTIHRNVWRVYSREMLAWKRLFWNPMIWSPEEENDGRSR